MIEILQKLQRYLRVFVTGTKKQHPLTPGFCPVTVDVKSKRYSRILLGRKGMLPIWFAIGVLAIQSCDRDKNNPGYDYFPDMAYSRAYETYAENPNFKDGKTLQAPADGTYSREGEYYPYKKTDADLLKAAKLKNPLLPDTANIGRGKVVFQNVCLQCHGAKADGKGQLFVSGKYPFPPANLLLPKTVNRTDGEIYHIITVGFGIMPPHEIIVQPNDRWKAVLYLRSLQGKTP